ncbi:MAG: hypothetical protein HZB26_26165 [Candidatus Hydrogenedentes bacterium]|nr:hypothetical protein [Candidatus Hydrogenedentota bacterium]
MSSTYHSYTKGSMFIAAVLLAVLPVWADNGPNHQVAQLWPVQLGTSGGSINDISRRYCCSGTLGALVQDDAGAVYILSNNHVLARSNQGHAGDDVNQPGMVDQNCAQQGVLADLSAFVPLQFKSKRIVPLNTVDCAIALARAGSVRSDGAILDIGSVSANTVSAFAGQAVQKSGRTTGRTVGSVAAIDVTVDVGYSKSCGGASSQVARFVHQIRISPGTFSAGGDSGSLIVESGATDPTDHLPRAVGLLFAGSSTTTIANPIDSILSSLGVTMVGGPAAKSVSSGAAGQVLSAESKKQLVKAQFVKAINSNRLLAIPGAVGHGVAVGANGQHAIEVYLENDSSLARAMTPRNLGGVPVQVVVTGPITAF